ncbi:Lipoprotein [Cupriavidus necator]|uniref:Lipoprotein n=2 Tax=Cupriavidus necator (strain ATCC 17699 / DSM 428 / KCTC 22496 / NCIMB 10442 / H16 / Stanier 337) TaxID=381666 RepID=A0AAE6DEZ0_CUPNH|nr:hypothetical protein [Cupriavidus necator]QCB99738.1 hypothetical protein E6A55_03325 [Cupriavidus necator H16]QQB77446.1 hypothetical protein I6H87_03745 [Cupriavidus necator]WKA41579.1 hypothetical protein QWP09_03315 [Cupriavidus necator]
MATRMNKVAVRRAIAVMVGATVAALLSACSSGKPMSNYHRDPSPYPLAARTLASGPNAPAAYVLGVQWMNPLMWKDYPTHWNLLWAQGMADRNPSDTDSPHLKLGDAPGLLVRGVNPVWKNDNPNPVYWKALDALIREPLYPLGYHTAVNANYFYSIRNGTRRPDFADIRVFAGMSQAWINTPTYIKESNRYLNGLDELAQHIRLGMPAPSILAENEEHAEARMYDLFVKIYDDRGSPVRGLSHDSDMVIGLPTFTLNAARRLFFMEIYSAAEAMSLKIFPEPKLANVTVMAGEEAVGFYDLQAAIAYLNANPKKTVWVYTMDAPNYPKGEQTNENSVLLILGHPSADWGYAPLAALYTPQQHEGGVGAKAATPGGAWQGLLQAVQAQVPQEHPVDRVYHDMDRRAPNVTTVLAPLRAAVHQQWPDLDQLKDFRSVSEHMVGPARAASAGLNIAYAVAYADQTGHSAVVTSVVDPNDAWTVLVAPPPGWTKREPPKEWPRARGRTTAYYPWFGKQTDGR